MCVSVRMRMKMGMTLLRPFDDAYPQYYDACEALEVMIDQLSANKRIRLVTNFSKAMRLLVGTQGVTFASFLACPRTKWFR
jgi:hypothetical protein